MTDHAIPAIESDGLVPVEHLIANYDQQLSALAGQHQAEKINRDATAESLEDRLAALDADYQRQVTGVRAEVDTLVAQANARIASLEKRYDRVKGQRDALK